MTSLDETNNSFFFKKIENLRCAHATVLTLEF
jgi:hypothetical protein